MRSPLSADLAHFFYFFPLLLFVFLLFFFLRASAFRDSYAARDVTNSTDTAPLLRGLSVFPRRLCAGIRAVGPTPRCIFVSSYKYREARRHLGRVSYAYAYARAEANLRLHSFFILIVRAYSKQRASRSDLENCHSQQIFFMRIYFFHHC